MARKSPPETPEKPAEKPSALDALTGAASQVTSSIKNTVGKVGDLLPSADTVKRGVGKALVTGGHILIDPRAAVGEMAASVGADLLGKTTQSNEWLVMEPGEEAMSIIARGTEAEMKKQFEKAIAQGRSVVLCQVRAAYAK